MIPLAVPNLETLEVGYVSYAIEDGWVGPDGPFVWRFEELVAKAAGRQWAVATITGTAALHVAAMALGFPGKLVDVPRDAFPAARNVFNQIDCAVVLTEGGECHDAQMYSWAPWPLLCDRAPAIGEPAVDAQLECYSFAANKIVTCGHGGAVVGDNEAHERQIRSLIRQGYGLQGQFNYRMANLNAALGYAQMGRLDELKAAKRRMWERYATVLPMKDRGPSRWMATMDVEPGRRILLAGELSAQDIETRMEPSGGLSLPCSTGLSETDQDEVIGVCAEFL